MRIAIIRREPRISFSMDVYADALVRGLSTVRPDWDIIQITPCIPEKDASHSRLLYGLQKYYERHIRFPLRLRALAADVFHIIDHSDGHFSYWLNLYKKTNIVTCHDLINLTQPETYKGRAKYPLISMAAWRIAVAGMSRADHIICVSENTKKDAIEHAGASPTRVSVVPNAVDSYFKPAREKEIEGVRASFGANKETFCLLNVGSNHIRKNVSSILKAVNILKREGLPILFWKVGDNFNEEQQEFIQKNGLQSSTKYLGSPNIEELISVYSSADVLVAPSLYEGFGLTVLEAMACGTAVIAADATSLPEVTGDSAILINPRSIESITNAIRRVYYSPSERLMLERKGIARAKEFTWNRTAEGVAKIYEGLVKSRSIGKVGLDA